MLTSQPCNSHHLNTFIDTMFQKLDFDLAFRIRVP